MAERAGRDARGREAAHAGPFINERATPRLSTAGSDPGS